jgi:hypothetical protein
LLCRAKPDVYRTTPIPSQVGLKSTLLLYSVLALLVLIVKTDTAIPANTSSVSIFVHVLCKLYIVNVIGNVKNRLVMPS